MGNTGWDRLIGAGIWKKTMCWEMGLAPPSGPSIYIMLKQLQYKHQLID